VQRKQILLVDDEHDIREVASMTLELIGGWDVVTASSGTECIRKAQEGRPDAILLDVMMPEMDGPSTLRHLKANQQTCAIPVIFITAKVQAADKRRFMELGVDAIISKPFDPLTLAGEVSAILGWS